MKFHTLATAAFATILLGSSLFAQKPDKPTTPNDEPRASQEETAPKSQQDQSQEAQDAKWQMKQQMFARCLVIANQEQVDLARYASEKSTNEDVKQFATAMVKAHTTCIEHLNDVSE
jgi:predicted outer membrane protein